MSENTQQPYKSPRAIKLEQKRKEKHKNQAIAKEQACKDANKSKQEIKIKITKAKFIKSASKMSESLDDLPQIAFLGRSNVGKSTLINSLTNTKALAKTSNTPGKTKLINFFEISFNEPKDFCIHLVDLPGFGYARVSKTQKQEWQKTLTEFLIASSNIRLFVLLIDSRHPDMINDSLVLEFLQKNKTSNQGIIKVYTKTDKLKRNDLRALQRGEQGHFFVSSHTKDGLDLLVKLMHEVCL